MEALMKYGGIGMQRNYDSWKTEQPDEPSAVTCCDSCGCELYEGDCLYTVNEEHLCEDCLNSEYRKTL